MCPSRTTPLVVGMVLIFLAVADAYGEINRWWDVPGPRSGPPRPENVVYIEPLKTLLPMMGHTLFTPLACPPETCPPSSPEEAVEAAHRYLSFNLQIGYERRLSEKISLAVEGQMALGRFRMFGGALSLPMYAESASNPGWKIFVEPMVRVYFMTPPPTIPVPAIFNMAAGATFGAAVERGNVFLKMGYGFELILGDTRWNELTGVAHGARLLLGWAF